MNTRLKLVVGSLAGAAAIHLLIAGCSSNGRSVLGSLITNRQALADNPSAEVKTADSDATQLRRGFIPASNGVSVTKLADGPFVLTDIVVFPNNSGGDMIWFLTPGATCPASPTTNVLILLPPQNSSPPIDGARFLVPAGQSLCAWQEGVFPGVAWAGFAPYH